MLAGILKAFAHGVVWAVAAGAAVALSWWGVHTVMSGTVYSPPPAVPIAGGSGTPVDDRPVASSTRRPRPSASPTGRPGPQPAPSAPPKDAAGRTPAPSDGVVQGYGTTGGRVVLDVGEESASLVSATPRSGWSMQVWKTSTWIRVDFRRDADEVSLICDWYHRRPHVEIVTH